MTEQIIHIAIVASEVPPRSQRSSYPEPFASMMNGREKRPLGKIFGLSNFAVNLTTLEPGSISALRHAHVRQEEFAYVLEGYPTLVTDAGCVQLGPGMCAGFMAGTGNAHQLRNQTEAPVVYLEIGDNTPDDQATYPDDDLVARREGNGWKFYHKDGSLY